NEEAVADKVEEYLNLGRSGKAEIYMNVVNLGEVYYIISKRSGTGMANLAVALIRREPLKLVVADERLALIAGRIKAFHRLSYADAFAVATAIDLDATLLTGDSEFKSVEDKVRVEWL
uniref:type II toxin-antitoxin system VapC family toxin n=1 Tax=Thermococcus sp. TaxID=35749 RepID=UPI00261834D7